MSEFSTDQPAGVRLSRLVTKLTHDEVPCSCIFTGGRSSLKCSFHGFGSGRKIVRWYALTHMHCISGLTSQLPSSRTPPQGPLRKVFGQVIGQVIPVECKTHWPHMRQSQIGFLIASSINGRSFFSIAIS